MKKVLSAALALGMVAGVATTASAAFDNFRVRGYYDLEGIYGSNTVESTGVDLGVKGTDVAESSAAWFQQNFRIYPVIEVNDKIKMSAEIRLMDDSIWSQSNTNAAGASNRDTDINKLYMEYTMGLGKLRMGRIPWGSYGHNFINASTRTDGFVYYSSLLPKPFGFIATYSKNNELDYQIDTDKDSDYYDIRGNYTTDTVNVHTRVGFTNDKTSDIKTTNKYRWGGFGTVKFMENYYVDFEWDQLFGDIEYDAAGTADEDFGGTAAMVKVGGNFGALDAGLTYWYVSGDDNDSATDNDKDAYSNGSMKDFTPLMILTGNDSSLLSNDTSGGYFTTLDIGSQHGANGLVLNFGYKVSDKLSLSSALGTAWADEEDYTNAASERITRDEDYGFEIDLGMEYKLLDNLTYSANFGYWDAGDFFAEGSKVDGVQQADTTEEDDVIMITHGLNMTF